MVDSKKKTFVIRLKLLQGDPVVSQFLGMKMMHYNKYFKVGWVPEVFLLQTLITTLVELTWWCFFSYYPHPAQDSDCFLK